MSDGLSVPVMVTEDVTATAPRLSPGTLLYDGAEVTLAIDDTTFVTSSNTLVRIPPFDDPSYATNLMWGPQGDTVRCGVIFLGLQVEVAS